jgi:hypothetical protein
MFEPWREHVVPVVAAISIALGVACDSSWILDCSAALCPFVNYGSNGGIVPARADLRKAGREMQSKANLFQLISS